MDKVEKFKELLEGLEYTGELIGRSTTKNVSGGVMTVKQLIEKLKEFDENLICYESEYGYEINLVEKVNGKIFLSDYESI